MRIQKLGLQIKAGVDFEIVNNESDRGLKSTGASTTS
ncbi:NADP-dependent malic enzyme [Klebsiella pneumoniae subsp. ozaenae]|uniref:NADP-dependent malic enzyme n=1 Tax=Klebsiella pneumoniae subsp. ozaenae TaxID=574 RepID=A0A378A473_KLEPO|nr:NADP-dependent malic enzyme [Klebsiella pneumoniae subsp. ozaenae]